MNWRVTCRDKHRREWRAGRGRYRIVWRDEVCGCTVAPGFQACVCNFDPATERQCWELVDRTRKRPLYKTLNAAKKACNEHSAKT